MELIYHGVPFSEFPKLHQILALSLPHVSSRTFLTWIALPFNPQQTTSWDLLKHKLPNTASYTFFSPLRTLVHSTRTTRSGSLACSSLPHSLCAHLLPSPPPHCSPTECSPTECSPVQCSPTMLLLLANIHLDSLLALSCLQTWLLRDLLGTLSWCLPGDDMASVGLLTPDS